MLKRLLHPAMRRLGFSPSQHGRRSYSQCGEDLLIDYVFMLRGIYKPTYIDIGAHDPFYLSNTALFYEKGCRGINVEANPQLCGSFRCNRPEDINLSIGVAESVGTCDFFVMEDTTLSTFSEPEMKSLKGFGHKLSRIEKIKVCTLQKILDENNGGRCPDLLSIDVEGQDLAILKTIDFGKTMPKVICAEAADYSPIGAGERRNDLLGYLAEKGYIEYANTNLNAIMVSKTFWTPSHPA
jgi:FkbM family methyltransferase